MSDESAYDDPRQPDQAAGPPGGAGEAGVARAAADPVPEAEPGPADRPVTDDGADRDDAAAARPEPSESPGSPPTPDELTRVEQVARPGHVRAAWNWTRRAARTTQQALSVHAEGLQNLPDGGAILAANHVWAGDFSRLRAVLDRPARLAAGSSSRLLRRRVRIDDPLQGDDAAQVLAGGGLVVVFPEGAPSPDDDIHRGGTDVAWLALTARVPVVPVGIVPARAGHRLLRPVTDRALGPTVIFGEPLDFSRFWEIPALSYALDGVLLRGVTDEIMNAIVALTGRTYSDTTPAQARELAAAARRQRAWARASEYPTVSQMRRAEAERREMFRERDEQDLARAAARARTGR
ncbi:MAG: hypothetical protein E7Z97_07875 [Propionibacteriaceae bacterium]|nr:hypothetical protein [Propionibacteriaceae bacterium]